MFTISSDSYAKQKHPGYKKSASLIKSSPTYVRAMKSINISSGQEVTFSKYLNEINYYSIFSQV